MALIGSVDACIEPACSCSAWLYCSRHRVSHWEGHVQELVMGTALVTESLLVNHRTCPV